MQWAGTHRWAGIVLAAGEGRRYGMPKALVRHDGRLLVQRAAGTLREAGCPHVVVVLGARAAQVLAAAPDLPSPVINDEWAAGMGSSLRAGLAALTGTPAEAAVVLLVDMPGVTPISVRRVAALAAPGALAMGGYGERRGHPVLLGRDHWAGVARSAIGDKGARDYLRSHDVQIVDVADVADDRDLDVPADPPAESPADRRSASPAASPSASPAASPSASPAASPSASAAASPDDGLDGRGRA